MCIKDKHMLNLTHTLMCTINHVPLVQMNSVHNYLVTSTCIWRELLGKLNGASIFTHSFIPRILLQLFSSLSVETSYHQRHNPSKHDIVLASVMWTCTGHHKSVSIVGDRVTLCNCYYATVILMASKSVSWMTQQR